MACSVDRTHIAAFQCDCEAGHLRFCALCADIHNQSQGAHKLVPLEAVPPKGNLLCLLCTIGEATEICCCTSLSSAASAEACTLTKTKVGSIECLDRIRTRKDAEAYRQLLLKPGKLEKAESLVVRNADMRRQPVLLRHFYF